MTNGTHDAWLRGFATALVEVHRQLIAAGEDSAICRVAAAAGLTIAEARRVGLDALDVDRLRKAGLR